MLQTLLKITDRISLGVLVVGAANSSAAGLTKTSGTALVARKNKAAVQVFYAGLAIAAAYKAIRLAAPKTKSEQRIEHIAQLYDQADFYNRRAKIYRRTAETFLRRRLNSLKTATSS